MHNSSVWLGDLKLQTMLTQHKCKVFNKCIRSSSNNSFNITHKKNMHFSGYKMYNDCEGFSIYYKLSQNDEYVRADNLPTNCSLIRFPINSSHGNLFNMLGLEILVEWKLSDECGKCQYGGGQCQTDKTNKFSCHKVSLLFDRLMIYNVLCPSRIWNETWLAGFFYQPFNHELFVKHTLNMEIAIVMAREAGVDWIIHLDTDELMHPAGLVSILYGDLWQIYLKMLTWSYFLTMRAVLREMM
ncbi:hypothetical protein H5410_061254 [Solanum commersonii]|uniref:Uncharacterized protein n=1 Tax=Solanum commersonii TaxID=4109 RepID=A0A9J5W8K8_SOLCO|nr:hypothetical protein H5410_061254 [Solanum commersonii]